jgi:hypothetical protein
MTDSITMVGLRKDTERTQPRAAMRFWEVAQQAMKSQKLQCKQQ